MTDTPALNVGGTGGTIEENIVGTIEENIVGTIEEDNLPLPLNEGVRPRLGGNPLPQHRFRLAISLLGTVAILAIGLVAAVMFTGESRLEALKSIAGIIFGPLVTLLGTSFAWYFAKSSE
jgi:hypothetical protein